MEKVKLKINYFILVLILLVFVVVYFQVKVTPSFSPDSLSSFITRVLPSESGGVSLNIFISDDVNNLLIAEKIPSGFVVSDISPTPDLNSNNTLVWYFSSFNGEKIIRYTLSGNDNESFKGKYGFEYEELSYEYAISGNSIRPVLQVSEPVSESSGGGGGGGGGSSNKLSTLVNNINTNTFNSTQKEVLNEQEDFNLKNILLSEGLSNTSSSNNYWIFAMVILITIIFLSALIILRRKK